MRLQSFIEAERADSGGSVKRCCELFEVSRSAFYTRTSPTPSRRELSDAVVLAKIKEVFDESTGTYGSVRVTKELKRRGETVGHRRVRRLMRCNNMAGRARKRWRATTVADPDAAAAADLIRRQFDPGGPIDARYVGDITYINTWQGWAYLATVIDLASRRVVGWAIADHMRTELVTDALEMAFIQRRPPPGLVFHSDRGSQYTSSDYALLARDHGVVLSVGRKGECWDNAVAESFFATIKRELIDTRAWPTIAGLQREVFDWIEGWYNTRRLHSSLGYRTPAEADHQHQNHQPQATPKVA
ncbi:MAG: IS3 family transposase [bacterium]|nr:IS3 family transposase [bacterium]